MVKDPPTVPDGRHSYCRFVVVSPEPPTQQYWLHAAVEATLGNLVTETLASPQTFAIQGLRHVVVGQKAAWLPISAMCGLPLLTLGPPAHPKHRAA